MSALVRFPNIKKAALEISYDNGGIHRDRSEAKMLRELNTWLMEHETFYAMPAIDAWLAGLSQTALQTVCSGEESEATVFLRSAPADTSALLNAIFESVG